MEIRIYEKNREKINSFLKEFDSVIRDLGFEFYSYSVERGKHRTLVRCTFRVNKKVYGSNVSFVGRKDKICNYLQFAIINYAVNCLIDKYRLNVIAFSLGKKFKIRELDKRYFLKDWRFHESDNVGTMTYPIYRIDAWFPADPRKYREAVIKAVEYLQERFSETETAKHLTELLEYLKFYNIYWDVNEKSENPVELIEDFLIRNVDKQNYPDFLRELYLYSYYNYDVYFIAFFKSRIIIGVRDYTFNYSNGLAISIDRNELISNTTKIALAISKNECMKNLFINILNKKDQLGHTLLTKSLCRKYRKETDAIKKIYAILRIMQ